MPRALFEDLFSYLWISFQTSVQRAPPSSQTGEGISHRRSSELSPTCTHLSAKCSQLSWAIASTSSRGSPVLGEAGSQRSQLLPLRSPRPSVFPGRGGRTCCRNAGVSRRVKTLPFENRSLACGTLAGFSRIWGEKHVCGFSQALRRVAAGPDLCPRPTLPSWRLCSPVARGSLCDHGHPVLSSHSFPCLLVSGDA